MSICPCIVIDACSPHCSCTYSGMSGGCQRCCGYGSFEQRQANAKRIASALEHYDKYLLSKNKVGTNTFKWFWRIWSLYMVIIMIEMIVAKVYNL